MGDQRQRIAEEVQRYVAEHPDAAAGTSLAQVVRRYAGGVIGDVEVLEILRQIRHDSVGVGPLEHVLAIPGVTDIVVNGVHGVWFDRGRGLEQATPYFDDEGEVMRLATRLLVASGNRLDSAQCYSDGRITRDDGSSLRVHAVLSPPSESGPLISIRVLRQADVSMADLIAHNTFTTEVAQILENLVRERRPLLIVGGTGSGKTTLLSALLATVPHDQRIICIEDTPELQPVHPHAVKLISRSSNTEGRGHITMTDLLRQALRMRPDRIVVGEIRGAEVVDLLAALNTGHDGCAGTLHANSLREVPARLEALAAVGGLDRNALHSQLAAARPVVIVMRSTPRGRRLHQIGELSGNPITPHVIWEET